jgi:hypothetical protein
MYEVDLAVLRCTEEVTLNCALSTAMQQERVLGRGLLYRQRVAQFLVFMYGYEMDCHSVLPELSQCPPWLDETFILDGSLRA